MGRAPDPQRLITGEEVLELDAEGNVVGQKVLKAGSQGAHRSRRLVLDFHAEGGLGTLAVLDGVLRSLKSVNATPAPPMT